MLTARRHVADSIAKTSWCAIDINFLKLLRTFSLSVLDQPLLPTNWRCRVYYCTWSHCTTHTRTHARTHTHTLQDSSGPVISPSQRPLPDNTQHSQRTDIHGPGGIRTRNPSKRAATDPRRRLRDQRDRPLRYSMEEVHKFNDTSRYILQEKWWDYRHLL
jgi:hypothetical protein